MITPDVYSIYLDGLLQGNHLFCSKVVEQLHQKGVAIPEMYEELFKHSLYEVGELWERNKISVATEHMATAITESQMIRLQPELFERERVGKSAVIACVANEYHQVGAKMIADIFEMNGWDTYFLGANTPADALMHFLEEKQPDMIGLSLSIYFHMESLASTLAEIRKRFPATPVILGGQAFRWGGRELSQYFNNVCYIESISQLEALISKQQADGS